MCSLLLSKDADAALTRSVAVRLDCRTRVLSRHQRKVGAWRRPADMIETAPAIGAMIVDGDAPTERVVRVTRDRRIRLARAGLTTATGASLLAAALSPLAWAATPSSRVPSIANPTPASMTGQGAGDNQASQTTASAPIVRPRVLYLAGGVENAVGEQSSLSVLNTDVTTAAVHLTFYFGDGVARAASPIGAGQNGGAVERATIFVGPHAQRTLAVALLVHHHGPFGLAASSDKAIALSLTLRRPGRDGDFITPATRLSRQWYLAEGSTNLTFHESLDILNPDPRLPARVMLRLMSGPNHPRRTILVIVPPHSESVVDVNQALPGASVSVAAKADRPVVVDRALTFGQDGYGLTTGLGEPATSTSWFFAEGATLNKLQTYLTVLNPGATQAHVTALYYDRRGVLLAVSHLFAPPNARVTLKLNDFLHIAGVSTRVASDVGVVAEMPLYLGSPNGRAVSGAAPLGVRRAARRWTFAGGDMAGQHAFLLLFNPGNRAAALLVKAYDSNGRIASLALTLAAHARGTVETSKIFAPMSRYRGLRVETIDARSRIVAALTIFGPHHGALSSTAGAPG